MGLVDKKGGGKSWNSTHECLRDSITGVCYQARKKACEIKLKLVGCLVEANLLSKSSSDRFDSKRNNMSTDRGT